MVTETHVLRPLHSDPDGGRPSALRMRLQLTGLALMQMITAPVLGATLFSVWMTVVALTPLTLLAPALIPVTSVVRRYADAHRRAAASVLARAVPSPYRAARSTGLRDRIVCIVRDPASWRDAGWLPAHAILACVTAAVTVALFLGGLFYLAYPLLYALTPHRVFGTPFGGLVTLHSTAQAFAMMPLAIVCFGPLVGGRRATRTRRRPTG